MSLVITSNIALEDSPDTSDAFKPYSYQNRLLNTMRIPPNSEIALQSAKINKNGLFVVDRANSGFSHFFGVPQTSNLDETTSQPFAAVIGAGEAFRAGGKTELNVDDMADETNKGINKATFHPSLITGLSSTGINVTTKYDSTKFEGFKFECTQQTAKTKRIATSIDFTDVSVNNSYNFTQAAGTVTSTDSRGFYVQNREYPISQNDGDVIFDFDNANDNGTSPFMCGLSRINTKQALALNVDEFDYLPDYFDTTIGGEPRNGIYKRGQFWFADICVIKSGSDLKVYQSSARTAAGVGSGIYLNEVIYYGAHNTKFPTIYNLSTNTKLYLKVKFTLNNEELSIYLIDEDGAETLLCDYTTLRAAGAVKNQCLNPTNACKWAMYPVCAASNGTGKTITLDSVEHYTNYPLYDASTYVAYDYWGYSQFNNLVRWAKELEMRDWNNYSRTTSGSLGNGLLAPLNINASGGMDKYVNTLITVRSDVYGDEITANCNTASTLGFVGMPVSFPDPVVTDLVVIFGSNTTPKLISNISLFIRLNNFTQISMNARQGTLSKIVAHLPRFDNSGNETGGLFYEPHTPTYLTLGNSEEILINSFDIDIVYDNETLCTALSGKTTCCFHIRQARN
tara:strand:- start:18 stop:1889 length:1872 start_codon:yes stop_codon:yes gene_type:complete